MNLVLGHYSTIVYIVYSYHKVLMYNVYCKYYLYEFARYTISSVTVVVTIGFSGTYYVHQDAGHITITVLILTNSLARDVVVTLSTLYNTARGRFS